MDYKDALAYNTAQAQLAFEKSKRLTSLRSSLLRLTFPLSRTSLGSLLTSPYPSVLSPHVLSSPLLHLRCLQPGNLQRRTQQHILGTFMFQCGFAFCF